MLHCDQREMVATAHDSGHALITFVVGGAFPRARFDFAWAQAEEGRDLGHWRPLPTLGFVCSNQCGPGLASQCGQLGAALAHIWPELRALGDHISKSGLDHVLTIGVSVIYIY